MPIRSRVFIHESRAGNLGLVLAGYTVPSGRTAIVKDFRVMNETVGPTHAMIGIRRGTSVCWLAQKTDLAGASYLQGVEKQFVAQEGDQLVTMVYFPNNAPGYVSIHASGSLLLGVPT